MCNYEQDGNQADNVVTFETLIPRAHLFGDWGMGLAAELLRLSYMYG